MSVPGEIHGYFTEYQNFGSGNVPWAQLVQPTIDILEKGRLYLRFFLLAKSHGFAGQPVSSSLASALKEKSDDIMKDPTLKTDFTNPKTGQVYARGEQITTR